jgi:ribosome biogenesis GTPase A
MASIFSIRPQFTYDKVINWFPGHMAKGLRVISERLSNVDLIVEARDARISFSINNSLKLFY